MRCIEVATFGLDHLKLVERPTPEPGVGEVRITVKAASLNYRDLLMVQGQYNPRQPLPLIPGSDGCGVIDAIGPGVASWKVGDRVAGCFATEWFDGEPTRAKIRATLGGPKDGMFATHSVLSDDAIVAVPDHLSDGEAATLPCAGVTAWNALEQLKPGESVLIQGTGGVSLFALQFAVLHGARAIVTSSDDTKLERAKAMGAAATINYKKTPEWGKAAKQLAGGDGVDLVLEVGGAGTLQESLKAVRVGGCVVLIGILAGNTAQVPLTSIFMQAVTVRGVLVGSRAQFQAMNKAISAAKLAPVIDRAFELKDTRAAMEHMQSQKHFGKIVLTTA